jgi:hypothetical protein
MPRNTIGGKGAKKTRVRKSKPVSWTDDSLYGEAIKILGGNIVFVKLPNKTTCQASFRGAIHKKQWIKPGQLLHLIYDKIGNGYEIARVINNNDTDYMDAYKSFNDSDDESSDEEQNVITSEQNNIHVAAAAGSSKPVGDTIKVGKHEIDFNDI